MIGLAITALAGSLTAQSSSTLQKDSVAFDPDGTAHITRVVPMPDTISAEAQQWLQSLEHSRGGPETLTERRKHTDMWRAQDSAEAERLYPVKIEETTTAGVRTDIISPLAMPEANRDCVLINLHGGGFNSDSGSLIEGVPIANLAKIKVVSVYYRLAPENPFPAAVDDVVAVYRELLKNYSPHHIGIFGTSAGAILTAEVTARLKHLGVPLPAALGIFSGLADFSGVGDSRQLFTLNGFPGDMQPIDPRHLPDDQYVGKTDRREPVLSPLFADLHGWPPTLLVTSTRDILLSDTSIFQRALLRNGNDAQLVVFEALPHAFWYHFQLPETKEALELMAQFFEARVER
ncbi:MAG TPA: alpha/beta hydrolase fold domain-containing protein [Verrucomicrobiae bacterium]|nr:alpha/beta hydrolase fold domain-containing protein [Verrucomicrobiae bacterium]